MAIGELHGDGVCVAVGECSEERENAREGDG